MGGQAACMTAGEAWPDGFAVPLGFVAAIGVFAALVGSGQWQLQLPWPSVGDAVTRTDMTFVETQRTLPDGTLEAFIKGTTRKEVNRAGMLPKVTSFQENLRVVLGASEGEDVQTAENWRSAVPRPGISVTEVVRTQLRALQQNNPLLDDGIEKTFQFASAGNQSVTGPLPRFADMIRSGFACMLNSADFELLTAQPASQDSYVVVVKVTANKDLGGDDHFFSWVLSEDGAGWRTVSVSEVANP